MDAVISASRRWQSRYYHPPTQKGEPGPLKTGFPIKCRLRDADSTIAVLGAPSEHQKATHGQKAMEREAELCNN